MWGLVVASLLQIRQNGTIFCIPHPHSLFTYPLFRRQYFPCPHPFFDYLPKLRSLKSGRGNTGGQMKPTMISSFPRIPTSLVQLLLLVGVWMALPGGVFRLSIMRSSAWVKTERGNCEDDGWGNKHTAGLGRVIIGTEEQREAIRVDGWRRIGLGRSLQQVPDWKHSILWIIKQIYEFIDYTSRIIEMRCSHKPAKILANNRFEKGIIWYKFQSYFY